MAVQCYLPARLNHNKDAKVKRIKDKQIGKIDLVTESLSEDRYNKRETTVKKRK